jgi:hypothetical protein
MSCGASQSNVFFTSNSNKSLFLHPLRMIIVPPCIGKIFPALSLSITTQREREKMSCSDPMETS